MKKPRAFTQAALRTYLGITSGKVFKRLVAEAGIERQPVQLHYTDDRPRVSATRKHAPFTALEVKRLLMAYRARQGARLTR